jgi:ribulose 1,5-bisphosphate synthetase/thiazole synthase
MKRMKYSQIMSASMFVAGCLMGGAVVDAEKQLPLVQDTDVVVVGGSSGAVAAAQKAAASGAKVFLVAPRPYLGEDMAGHLNLRADVNDDTSSELYSKIFKATAPGSSKSLPFTYQANAKPAPRHSDPKNTRMTDGAYSDSSAESVEFDKDVEYTLDLGTPQEIGGVLVYAFIREGSGGFATEEVAVQTSSDAKAWSPAVTAPSQGSNDDVTSFNLPLPIKTQYLKVTAKKQSKYARQLLGEICVYPAAEPDKQEKKPMASETTPFKIKRTLDEALLKAGIPFLTGAFATDILTDESGKLAGVVIASRSGRQAIRAKVVVDATERGMIARAAGAKATPFPSGDYTFKRTLISGEPPPKAENMRVSELLGIYNTNVKGVKAPKDMPSVITGRMYVCEITLPMKDGSARSFAEAEQKARDQMFTKTQLDTSDTMAFLPPDQFNCKASSKAPWSGVGALDLGVFQPADVENLFVLGPLADVSRDAAQALMKPGNLMAVGTRVGETAAAVAKARKEIGAVKVAGHLQNPPSAGMVGEGAQTLPHYLSNMSEKITFGPRTLPTLAVCDVVVAGAGTGGAPAGISAARQGAKTIVCEYLYQMGGVQTEGMIGVYYFGNRRGFTTEIDTGVAKMGAVLAQAKSEWYRQECRKAGAEIWYGTVVSGVVTEGNKVTGVIVVMQDGTRGVIQCKVAIDATGNADLAAMAGEETEFMRSDEIAVQGVGQTIRSLGTSYANNDFSFVDDTDASDLCFFSLRARMSMPITAWDQSQIVNSRERRRLIGAFYMNPMDVMNNRTYPDVVVQSRSNFDSHGHTVCEQFFIDDPGHKAMLVNLPYRCFLPKRVEGLLVVGLGISAHRDAMPILRMQPDVQNQGYAAGVAAAMSIKAKVTVRDVNMRALQQHLIEKDIITRDVLEMKDSFPLPKDQFVKAAETLTNNYDGLSVVLTDYTRSVPLLREAMEKSKSAEAKLKYAHVLAMMGEADGETLLIEKVKAMKWDVGWNFRGMGQFGRSVSWVDSYLIALGRSKSTKALPVILEKARELTVTNEFSHFRALAIALEGIGDASAAPALAELLKTTGISGYSISMDNAKTAFPILATFQDAAGNKERTNVLRELSLARALYRLGDSNGLGEKILSAYARDPRGMYANHAKLVLAKHTH